MENNTNKMQTLILSAILIIFIVFTATIVIIALNQANNSSGVVITNSSSQTLYFFDGNYEVLSVPNGATCSITSITNTSGGTIPTSNYSINNCAITYIP